MPPGSYEAQEIDAGGNPLGDPVALASNNGGDASTAFSDAQPTSDGGFLINEKTDFGGAGEPAYGFATFSAAGAPESGYVGLGYERPQGEYHQPGGYVGNALALVGGGVVETFANSSTDVVGNPPGLVTTFHVNTQPVGLDGVSSGSPLDVSGPRAGVVTRLANVALADGSYGVAWLVQNGQWQLQLVSKAGTLEGGPVALAPNADLLPGLPPAGLSLVALPDGGFAAIWQTTGATGSAYHAQEYSPAAAAGPAFQITPFGPSPPPPQVAALSDGNLVVVQQGSAGTEADIYAPDGTMLSTAPIGSGQSESDVTVTALPDAEFMVAGFIYPPTGTAGELFDQVFREGATNDAPVIAGAQAGQATTDCVAIEPFATVTVGDVDPGAQDSLTVTLTNGASQATDANGALAGAGLTKVATGTYALAATTPAALTGELDALTFTPTRHEAGAGQTTATGLTLTASQTANGSTVTATDATASVVATSLNYVDGPAKGFGVLQGTSGQDVITAHGRGNAIFGNGGSDVIDAGGGLGYVDVAGGNASVTLGGGRNVVVGGDGRVTVTGAAGGNALVTLGNGGDVVGVGGRRDVILLGNGDNVVGGTQGMAFIATGSGDDTIVLAGRGSTVDAGGGVNAVAGGTGADTFVLPVAGRGFDAVTGFSETNGDRLDLRAALAGTDWDRQASTLGNYLKVTGGTTGTTLSISPTAGGAATAVARLGGSDGLQLSDLLGHHSLYAF